MGQVTIREVAKRAGVSITTVSRVLTGNAKNHMRPETEERVLQAIRELDYSPNKYARALKRQRTGVIGVLAPDISNPFFSRLLRGVENVAYRHDYLVLTCDAENSLEKENRYIELLIEERVEGVILISAAPRNEEAERLLRKGIHLVMADRRLENIEAPVVIADDFKAGYILTKYLLGLGYREIGFIQGPLNLSTARDRFRGFLRAMEEEGVEVHDRCFKEADYTFEGGYRAAQEILNGRLPQAIIAANDLMAIGAIRALEDNGFSVPQDIGIAGFDNIPLAALAKPRLTTIAIPAYEMGQEAMEMLMRNIT
ncbi:TPA: LacI family transcriptional regulator, partial [Candidatus Bipolaricaulota bacterium]|nr:LacI family transcriptional regulator [Candidatus Bipolaricaulota bacterium]